MSTATPNKTDSGVALAHSFVEHPNTLVGAAIDCRTKRAAIIFLYHGYVEDTADTNPGKFLVQVRPDAGDGSVTENWITVFEGTARGTDPDAFAPSASESVGATVIEVPSTAGAAIEDELYYQDRNGGSPTTTGVVTLTGAEADSEWCKCRKFSSNTSITLVDGITNAKDSSDQIKNDASKWVIALDLNGIESFRVVWMHEGATGANGHVKADYSTYDSDNITA